MRFSDEKKYVSNVRQITVDGYKLLTMLQVLDKKVHSKYLKLIPLLFNCSLLLPKLCSETVFAINS